ncbi:MAG TPA: glycosyl transferase family 2 [Hyphomonadaceae bacterium]|nr:glycosyl transferase family 2 [Hyphomonadaceae bacterium]
MPISVIIPALNAALSLPTAIASVACADEIIVVDGGSSDGSAQTAAAAGARVISAARGRGTQLAAGARAARNDWRLFLHADTQLAPGWAPLVRDFSKAGADRAATFRFALDDASWQARALEQTVDWRTRWLGLPYGDQGLLIHRDLYEALGGFRPVPIMEDIDIVRRIGRARLIQLDHRAVTSAIRWRRRGWLRQSLQNQFCLALYFAGVTPERIRQIYES